MKVKTKIKHLNNQNMFTRLGFLTFFSTKINKICIDMCIVSYLQDSCYLGDNRCVGV